MRKWIIKILGGYTEEEYATLARTYEENIEYLRTSLVKRANNDQPRDPKTGRFTKK